MQHGDLVVSGKDKVSLNVGKRIPQEVIVKFQSPLTITPCNPHHFDDLEWELIEHHDHHHNFTHFELEIRWKVTGIRVILWSISY